MKKGNLVTVFVLALAIISVLTSCASKKKPEEKKPKSPIEQVALMCFVKGNGGDHEKKKAYWIFTDRTRLECPNWSDPFIVEDSLALHNLWRLDYTGIAKVQIDTEFSSDDALYFERSGDMKMIKTDEVYVSYGKNRVVQYGMINEKLYVKKLSPDELVAMFPKNIRDVMTNLGVYVLNK